jgi:hypothetical protein
MFSLFGLPVLCLALWLGRADRGHAPGLRAELGVWALCLAPAISMGLLIVGAEARDAFRVPSHRLYGDAVLLDVIDPNWLGTAFLPLRVSVVQNAEGQLPQIIAWLTGDPAMEVIHPTTVVLLFLASCLLWARRRGLGRALVSEAVALVAVVLAPLGIVAIGGDWSRFMMLSHFHGFAVLLVILSAREHGRPARRPRVLSAAILGASVWAIHTSVRSEIPLTAPRAGVDRAFVLHWPDRYACSRRLFPNSEFSEGTLDHWQVEGNAFHGQPLYEDTAALRGSPAQPTGNWVGTYEASPTRPSGGISGGAAGSSVVARHEGDVYKGKLRSQPFRIDGDRIVFRVSGGWDEGRVFVRLLVDGEEVERVTGRNQERFVTRTWDVDRHRGREAVIEIVDDSSRDWGHINAEGFCYER